MKTDWEKMENDWKKQLEDATLRIKFVCIDDWNRPVFKAVNLTNYFIGDTDHLFDYDATEEAVLNFYKDKNLSECLTYFGDHAGCEPWGMTLKTAKIELD